jgi:hypothetical protein
MAENLTMPDFMAEGQRMELGRTSQQQIIFLNAHWGTKYSFAAPETPDALWTATAKFGQHNQLQEWSAAALLEQVRGHYEASRPKDDARR